MQPQLAVVPAQVGALTHSPAEHTSVVHAFASLHAAQPLRAMRVSVTVNVQLVPLQVNVRNSWFWQLEQRSVPLPQHAYVLPTSYQPLLAAQFVHVPQPQLVAVPAQIALNAQVPLEHVSAVHALPSLHVVQPLRTTRVLVTLKRQLVPLHRYVRYSWSWHAHC